MKHDPSINLLDLTPIALITHQINQDGKVELLIPRFSFRLLQKWFMNGTGKKFIRLKLDYLGSQTWILIDGQRNVGEICQLLTGQLGEIIQPTEERVAQFMRKLLRDKYIRFREI